MVDHPLLVMWWSRYRRGARALFFDIDIRRKNQLQVANWSSTNVYSYTCKQVFGRRMPKRMNFSPIPTSGIRLFFYLTAHPRYCSLYAHLLEPQLRV